MRDWIRSLMLVCLLCFAAVELTGCSGKGKVSNDPKQRLTDYISHSFSVKSLEDRKALLEFLSGDSKNRLSAWSDEQFREAFMDSKRQFLKLSLKEIANVSATEVNITYELSYMDQGKGSKAKVTNKKLARMILDQGKWMISDVKNIKELVEYGSEMSLP